jgi:hypothetical protein
MQTLQESEFTQGCMKHFSSALSRLDLTDFMPRVSAEAKQSDLETVEDAAVSQLRPIQDAPDMWELHRSSAVTGLSVSAPGQDVHNLLPSWENSSLHDEIRLGTKDYV